MSKKLKTVLVTLLIMLMILAVAGLCVLTNGMFLVISLVIVAIIALTVACYSLASIIVDTKEEMAEKRKKDFNHENH